MSKWHVKGWMWIALALVAAFAAGWLAKGGGDERAAPARTEVGAVAEVWTCSMHPQIRLPKSGRCPICGMDLILQETSIEDDGTVPRLAMSAAARTRAGIATRPVERRAVRAEVGMVGKIDYDETQLSFVTAWVPGRLERLYVDYTGISVEQGDHMVDLYSPELYSAQEVLLQLLRDRIAAEAAGRTSARTDATIETARERLRQLGLATEQVEEIERRGTASYHVTIRSPIRGVVIDKNAQQGMYVDTGTRIYTVADFAHLWVWLEAYERDLAWLRYGQDVEFETQAWPGQTFHGRIAFIDPVLDARTRTVKVRVNLDNSDGRLKPEMFVRARVTAPLVMDAGTARVMAPDLAGKWMCPMHPEVVRDEPGACDVCGMDLVTPESRGYVAATEGELPLVIPSTAPLLTGDRAVVYVEVPDPDRVVFEGREVVLGPRAGADFVVLSGLEEGERVVTHGAFKIDSSLQIQARPSMMLPQGGVPGGGAHDHGGAGGRPATAEAPPAFRAGLGAVWGAYQTLQGALAADDASAAAAAAVAAGERLAAIDASGLAEPELGLWRERAGGLAAALAAAAAPGDIAQQRTGFEHASHVLRAAIERWGIDAGPVHVVHCPMWPNASGGKGVDWLQSSTDVLNPYYGSSMLTCGRVTGTLVADGDGDE